LSGIEIQPHAVVVNSRLYVSFQRTRRVPARESAFPPPSSLGALPVHGTAQYGQRLPSEWISPVGVFLPIVPGEAFWIGFRGSPSKPAAVKVAVDELDAISGTAWREGLHDDPQDYIVCPPQLSLDGVHTNGHMARQFVATEGPEKEDQTKTSRTPMSIVVYDPKKGRFSDTLAPRPAPTPNILHSPGQIKPQQGSLVEQDILPDPHGIECWDQKDFASLLVYWLNPGDYRLVTGQQPPPPASMSEGYQGYLLP
jgi:hypothetical protein